MVSFSIGDRLVCVHPKAPLVLNGEYTVLWMRRFPDGVILEDVEGEWHPTRFKASPLLPAEDQQ